jgi:hypothetical protein
VNVEYRSSPPPVPPLWEGVYTFPGRPENIVPWLLLTAYLTLIGLFAAGLNALLRFIILPMGDESVMFGLSPIVLAGSRYIFTGLLVLTLFFSLHVSILFSRVVEDTAGGRDEVGWPKEPWLDLVGKWFFLLWLVLCSVVAGTFLSGPVLLAIPAMPKVVWLYVALALAWFCFPVFLLSTMSAASPWVILDPNILVVMARKPAVTAFLYLNALLIFVPAALVGALVIMEFYLWLTPVMGLVWSTALLSYARVLGRAGYAYSYEGKPKRKLKKRKKIRRESDEED